jgi:hypothetical protein
LLEREGVVFDARGRVPLARVRWRAGARRRRPSGVALKNDAGLLGA